MAFSCLSLNSDSRKPVVYVLRRSAPSGRATDRRLGFIDCFFHYHQRIELIAALRGKQRERIDPNQLPLFEIGELEKLIEETPQVSVSRAVANQFFLDRRLDRTAFKSIVVA